MEEAKTNIISIDGTDYNPDDLNDQQKYYISQVQHLMQKANNMKFNLDQVQIAQNQFTSLLVESLKPEEKEKENVTNG